MIIFTWVVNRVPQASCCKCTLSKPTADNIKPQTSYPLMFSRDSQVGHAAYPDIDGDVDNYDRVVWVDHGSGQSGIILC